MKFTDLISAFYSASALASSNFRLDIDIALCDIDVMGQIGFTPTATRQWLKLSPQVRERIGKKLDAFASTEHGDVKRLKGQAGARLRVGDWRVIFTRNAERSLWQQLVTGAKSTIERRS